MSEVRKVLMPQLPLDAVFDADQAYDMKEKGMTEDYQFPYTIYVREVYTKYARKAPSVKHVVTIPKVGVLTMQDRDFEFEYEPEYRRKKQYPAKLKRTW